VQFVTDIDDVDLLEQLGFRQLHLLWRQRGIWRWPRGKHVWGEMTRRGLGRSRI
jgi:hypothetical protein